MTVANLGQIIKARRERMKINQENLAACAGISTKLLSDIECGRANPTFETMDLVAAALGVELEELLQPEQVIDLLPKNDLARYQQMLDRLPPFAQEMVIAGLEGARSPNVFRSPRNGNGRPTGGHFLILKARNAYLVRRCMCQQRRAANGSDAKCAASLAAFISPPGMMSARRAKIPSTARRAASRLGIPPTANRTSAVLLKAVSTGPGQNAPR